MLQSATPEPGGHTQVWFRSFWHISKLHSIPLRIPGGQSPKHAHVLGLPNAAQLQICPSRFTHLPPPGEQVAPVCASGH
jgi:hypothetical protein